MRHINKIAILIILNLSFSCSIKQKGEDKLKEEDKIFHAAPSDSGFGATFFGLFKNNKYEFCDGDFMDDGCYTGDYELNGDTLTLHDLKLNDHVRSNRFIIYRFDEQDSTYWKKKYPTSNEDWTELKKSDYLRGNSGDIYELDKNNQPRTKVNYWYVIRFDQLK